jgi:signal transduction histidine kinase
MINGARAFYERTASLRENRTTSYVFGLATIALALLARFILARQLAGFPFLVFFPAILVTSFVCGWRAGAVAAVFGGFAARYFFSGDSLPIRVAVTSTWVGYALYAFAVVIVLFLVRSMHLAFHDFAESENKRKRLNEELESRVCERTIALEEANQRLRDEAASLAAAEARIRQMQKMEAVGQLTGGIAHDFNNMLAVIVGSLDIAKRQLHVDPAKSERFMANALDGAQRGAQLTSRLLAFSRQQPLEPRPLDANKLVRETSELLRRSLGENIHLETVLADDLWRIFADAPQLESTLINLCVNSRDAMPDGGSLTLRTANVHLDNPDGPGGIGGQSGDHVALVVHDTGCGMSPEVLARAFDPFYTTKAPGQGTGLGLSQVYGFVSQSGGHISIDSQLGTGATVSIHLPRYVGSDQGEAAPSAKISPSALGNKEVILVVEDEDRVRAMTVEALRDLGYSVISASGGQQALDELNAIPHLHLVVTDVVMPGMNGPALAGRIKALRPSVKVLYTTGYARNAVLSDGMLDREVGILQKPFTIDQLRLKVQQALGE